MFWIEACIKTAMHDNHCVKVPVFGVILDRILQHSDWIQRDAPCLPYSIQMLETMDQNKSEYGHLLRSEYTFMSLTEVVLD